MPAPRKSSLLVVALVAGLAGSGREVVAQTKYVGTFALTNGDTIRCLTDIGNTAQSSALMYTAPWAAAAGQQWGFFLLPNGYYAIMNVRTTEFLTQATRGASETISTEKWAAKLAQQWYLYPLGGQSYALVNVETGRMLSDYRNMVSQGTVATARPWRNELAQWWHLSFLRN